MSEILETSEGCLPERLRTRPKQLLAVKKTILIVEADVALLGAIADILRWAGYEILSAYTTPEAISICERFAGIVDLVLSDFNLPGSNGAELAENIAILYPSLPIIFMSGNKTASQNLRSKGRIVLEKPFSFAEMTYVIHEILGTSTTVATFPKPIARSSMQ